MLGKALRCWETAEGWQDVAKKFHEDLQTGASQETHVVFSALQAALNSLGTAGDRVGREAIKAFNMLQHVQSSRVLPTPMLKLLCSWAYPNEHIAEVEALLQRLVQASLLYKQVRRVDSVNDIVCCSCRLDCMYDRVGLWGLVAQCCRTMLDTSKHVCHVCMR
jgi:hypothetical protein